MGEASANRIQEDLFWKIAKHKRNNIMSQVKSGCIKSPEEKTKLVRRPMINALFSIVSKQSKPDKNDFAKLYADLRAIKFSSRRD